MELVDGHLPERIETVRELFTEYQRWLGVDLCFQGFDQELRSLPGRYAPPRGRILLAIDGDAVAGCVALRPLDVDGENDCEMKRLYLREAHRGKGLGRRLAESIVAAGRDLGYGRMWLDTLSQMQPAITLYHSLGFVESEPYYGNPLSGARYFALSLQGG